MNVSNTSKKFLTGVALLPINAMAQLDTSGSTSAIQEGVAAVLAVLIAMILAYSTVLGARMLLSYVMYGNFQGLDPNDPDNYDYEEGLDDGFDQEGFENYQYMNSLRDEFWLSEESQTMDFYQWCDKHGHDYNPDDDSWL